MPVKMIAARRYYSKSDRKEYEAGQEFTVSTKDEADRLVLRRKARMSTVGRVETAAPRAAPPADDLAAMRSKFAQAKGHPPHFSWGIDRIRIEMEKPGPEPEAGGTYGRRDMRAEG